jgi:hypothetical protein
VAHGQQVVQGDDAALRAITRPAFDPRDVVVTERPVAGVPEAGIAPRRAGPPGEARIERYEPDRVVLRARTGHAGMVVLADTYFPGWTAKVDGRDTPVERVNYVLRGVPIGPGAHTVELRYEPLSWTIGWIVSAIALAGLAGASFVGLGRRRRGSGRAGGPALPPDRGVEAPDLRASLR